MAIVIIKTEFVIVLNLLISNLQFCFIVSFSGTRTWKRRDSAQKKIDSYYSKLGRLV